MRIEEPDPHGRAGWTRRLVGRGAAVLAAALIVSAMAGSSTGVSADEESSPTLPVVVAEVRAISQRLEAVRGELAVARAQAERAEAILRYSGQYQIPGDLAAAIYDIAVSEGIETDVAFRLVKVESNFEAGATSHRGAIGYTQVLPSAAQFWLAPCAMIGFTLFSTMARGTMPREAISRSIQAVATPPLAVSSTRILPT